VKQRHLAQNNAFYSKKTGNNVRGYPKTDIVRLVLVTAVFAVHTNLKKTGNKVRGYPQTADINKFNIGGQCSRRTFFGLFW
jgi:hypothetical protein